MFLVLMNIRIQFLLFKWNHLLHIRKIKIKKLSLKKIRIVRKIWMLDFKIFLKLKKWLKNLKTKILKKYSETSYFLKNKQKKAFPHWLSWQESLTTSGQKTSWIYHPMCEATKNLIFMTIRIIKLAGI